MRVDEKSRAARIARRPSTSASEIVQNVPFGKTPRTAEKERRTVQAQAARKQTVEKRAKPGASSLLRQEQNDEAAFTLREGDHSRARALQIFELGHQEHPPRTPNQTRGRLVNRSRRRQSRSTAPRDVRP
jgi:hypothetical protein